MANQFPIGSTQTLSFKTLSLILGPKDFNPSGEAGLLGYKRTRIQDHWHKVKYLVAGTPSISGRKHFVKYEFAWDLILPAISAFKLEAMYQEQRVEYELFGPKPEIRLKDSRLVFLALATPNRERAKIGTVASLIEAPTGFTYIYPQFNIAMTNFSMEPYILGNVNLWNVKMQAVELEPVPITEDA